MRGGLCAQCGVHPNLCVCDDCQIISGSPPLWLLQHPQEVGHSKGTARIAQACLPGLQRLVGEQVADFQPLAARVGIVTLGVIFPTRHSQPLETAATDAIQEWIVIDGTWRKANRLFLSNPWLMALPQFHFEQPPASTYRIRKRPGPSSLATAEAISYTLSLVAPDCDRTPLDRAMSALVERQLDQIPEHLHGRYR